MTEEFHPGFRNSVAAYTVSLVAAESYRRSGSRRPRTHDRPAQRAEFSALAGRSLSADRRRPHGARNRQIFRPRCGRAMAPTRPRSAAWRTCCAVSFCQRRPISGSAAGAGCCADCLRAWRLRRARRQTVTRPTRSARRAACSAARRATSRRLLRERSDQGGARLRRDGRQSGQPLRAGLGLCFLHHAFGEVNGKRGVWGHAVGGMGAITQAMARAAASHGVRIRLGSPVREVHGRRRSCVGVVLGDGTAVPSAHGDRQPRSAHAVPEIWCRRRGAGAAAASDARFASGSGTFRMNVALSNCQISSRCPGRAIISPPASSWRRASLTWTRPTAMRRHGWSRKPIVEMVIPSTLDDTLAPKGAHVASLFCQHVAPDSPDGSRLGRAPREVADLMIDDGGHYAPGFKA